MFVSEADFDLFTKCELDVCSNLAADFKSKQFMAIADTDTPANLLSTKLRTRKAYLRMFTSLHMIVLTGCCNCRCEYCQASSVAPEGRSFQMQQETAERVVDMIFKSPSPVVKIEFQGGEPTLNLPVLRHIVEYAKRINRKARKHLEFVVCTNLTTADADMLTFFRDAGVSISTSLDGPKDIHDRNRVSRNGSSSHDTFVKNLAVAREIIGESCASPLLTVTRHNISRLREVVDEYLRLGFQGIFLRTLNPYGMAKEQWESLGYPVDEFVEAYKDVLQYIIEINLRGRIFNEYYTCLLMSRILTPFSTGFVDLQSPSGAGIQGVIYDFDGNVYPTDESRMLARMGDSKFRLGSVHTDSYADIFLGSKLRELIANSCVETLPGCAHCAYQLYCGADPIRNYVESGDIVGHRPTSDFCKRNMTIFDHLFHLLHQNDRETIDVFWSWITNRRLEDVCV